MEFNVRESGKTKPCNIMSFFHGASIPVQLKLLQKQKNIKVMCSGMLHLLTKVTTHRFLTC